MAAWADSSPLPTAAAALSEQLQVLESVVVGHAVKPAVAVPVLQSVLRQLAVVEFEAAWATDPSAEGTNWVQFRCGGVRVGITLMLGRGHLGCICVRKAFVLESGSRMLHVACLVQLVTAQLPHLPAMPLHCFCRSEGVLHSMLERLEADITAEG